MDLNSGRSPQVTNALLWKWLQPNYAVYLDPDPNIAGDTFPASPNDGDIFYYTVDNKYYQYDASLSNWVCLGPEYNYGYHLGNLPTGWSCIHFYDSKSEQYANLFLVYDTDTPPAPLLMIDQGFIVKKVTFSNLT